MHMKNGIIVLILGGLLAAILFLVFHIGEPGFGLSNQGGKQTEQTPGTSTTTTATGTPPETAGTTTTPAPEPEPSSGSTEEMGNVNGLEVLPPSTETSPGTNVTTQPPPESSSPTTTEPPTTTTTTTTSTSETTGSGTTSSGTTTAEATSTETTPPPPPPAPTSHLVGHWTFDSTEGIVIPDSSEYGNDGAVVNSEMPLWETGYIGEALRFDGIDDYADIPRSNSLDLGAVGESYTISVWFKNDVKHSGEHEIVGKGGRSGTLPFGIRIDNTGDPSFRISDGLNAATAVSDDSIVSGTWHHLVGVRDAAAHRIYLYVDGVGIDSVNDPTTQNMQNTSDITLNHYEGIDGYYYDTFAVDDLRIYNRLLTSDEIEQLYEGANISN